MENIGNKYTTTYLADTRQTISFQINLESGFLSAMYFLYTLIGLVALLGIVALTVLCYEVAQYQKHKLKLKGQNSEKASSTPGKFLSTDSHRGKSRRADKTGSP